MLSEEGIYRVLEWGSFASSKFPVWTWWEKTRNDPQFEFASYIALAIAYAVLGTIAGVQLYRISKRVPEYGWTTQKLFHLLNLIVCALRFVAMATRVDVEHLKWLWMKRLLAATLNDVPGLLFFSTYTLLVLFWAEIYHQAKGHSTTHFRPLFRRINVCVYVGQTLLILLYVADFRHSAAHGGQNTSIWKAAKAFFLVVVSFIAGSGFVLYGGRLVFMLRRFPHESRGRTRKMYEVGIVALICTICFSFRAVFLLMGIADRKDFAINVLNHPFLNMAFYFFVELLPTGLVLFILRKLPPRRQEGMGPITRQPGQVPGGPGSSMDDASVV